MQTSLGITENTNKGKTGKQTISKNQNTFQVLDYLEREAGAHVAQAGLEFSMYMKLKLLGLLLLVLPMR